MRGIDHLVLCAHDLDAVQARYREIGFTLTPKALHPFGTANALVQLQDRSFLELLAVEDASAIPTPGEGQFSFARFNQRYIEDGPGEGFSMLVLDSSNSEADHAEFSKAGLKPYEHFGFTRQAKLPSGEEVEVQFSMAFVTNENMPDAAFFTCQQHHAPELFWKAEYQSHANSAVGIGAVIMLAGDPARNEEFFTKLSGAEEVLTEPGLVTAKTARGDICVMSIVEWAKHYPQSYAPDTPSGPRLAAYVVKVGDMDAAENCLRTANIAYLNAGHDLVIAPDAAFGTMIVFSSV